MSETLSSYNKNGFVILKNIISKDILDCYLKDFHKIIIQQLDFLKIKNEDLDIFNSMKVLYNADKNRYLSTLTLSSKLFNLYKIISEEPLINELKLLGISLPTWQTKPVIHCMSDELKIEGGYHGLGVHQDWRSLQSSLNTIIAWIPFFNVTKENYPIQVIPKSHLYGLCDGLQTDHFFEIDKNIYNQDDFIELEADVGDVIIMSSFLIHKSKTNGNGFRFSVSMRYEDSTEETFIERNYPYTEKRIVDRKILFDEFPSNEQLYKIYK